MPKVEWIGKPGLEVYQGAAGGEDEIRLHPGAAVEVSEEQADYLLENFGEFCSIERKGKARGKKAEAIEVAEGEDAVLVAEEE